MIKTVRCALSIVPFFLGVSHISGQDVLEEKKIFQLDLKQLHEFSDEKLIEIEEVISSVRNSRRESSQLSRQLKPENSMVRSLDQFEKSKNQLVLYGGLQKNDKDMVLAINFSGKDFFESSIQTFFVTNASLQPKATIGKKNLLAESRTFSFGNFYDLKRSCDRIKDLHVPLDLYVEFSNNFKILLKNEKLDFFHKNTIQFSGYVDEQFFRVCARYYILCEEIWKTITQLQKGELPSIPQLLHYLDIFDQSGNELLKQIFYVPENIACFFNGVLHVDRQIRDNHIQRVQNKNPNKILVEMGRSTLLFKNTNVRFEEPIESLNENTETNEENTFTRVPSTNSFLEEDVFPQEKSRIRNPITWAIRKIKDKF